MINLPKFTDFNFQNKSVLVRVDIDLSVADGKVEDDTRIRACLPTIEYLLENRAKVILMGHLGRPEGKIVKELSLKPVAQKLKEILGIKSEILNPKSETNPNFPIFKIQNFDGFQISENTVLLENLRFDEREEKNDEDFAKELAELGDFYVNEAFAASHREHASIVGVPKFLPHCAGFNFAKEIENLSKVLENPKKPVVFVVGGAKPETKLPLVVEFAKKADWVLVGGLLPTIKIQNDILKFKNIIWGELTKDGLDIDKKSIKKFSEIIQKAKTIVWNGPMGKFEEGKRGERGTRGVMRAIIKSSAFKVVGGGDTINALNKFGLYSKMDFVSLGGGAMLEFLTKGTLPGIQALRDRDSGRVRAKKKVKNV